MVPGVVATAVPSYDIVIPELAVKLLPVTVTVVPAFPLVGLRDIDACVVAGLVVTEAELEGALVPIAFIADTRYV